MLCGQLEDKFTFMILIEEMVNEKILTKLISILNLF